jgi:hypothetical protein
MAAAGCVTPGNWRMVSVMTVARKIFGGWKPEAFRKERNLIS